jgi:hypothetical protein
VTNKSGRRSYCPAFLPDGPSNWDWQDQLPSNNNTNCLETMAVGLMLLLLIGYGSRWVWAVGTESALLSRSGTTFSSDDFLHHEIATATVKKEKKRSDEHHGTEAFGYVITLATGLLLLYPPNCPQLPSSVTISLVTSAKDVVFLSFSSHHYL